MEREARANFRVIRVNRWSLAVVVLAALAALLLPMGQWFSARESVPERVEPGVSLLGHNLGGLSAAEARAVLEQLNQATAQGGTAPAARMDVETTLFRLLTAPRGAAVEPAWAPAGGAPAPGAGPAGSGGAAPGVGAAGNGGPAPGLPVGGQSRPQPVTSAPAGKQAVTLLLNVAWGDPHLPDMLATLSRHQVRTTFMVVGRWAQSRPDLLRRIAADGHEIGNHGYDDRRSPLELHRSGTLRADIEQAGRVIAEITGRRPAFYQPHKGELDPKGEMVKLAADLGYTTVLWTQGRDTKDWMEEATAASVLRVVAEARDGDIILMHPSLASRQALDQALAELKRKQLRVVPLGELLGAPTPRPAQGPAQGSPRHPGT